MIIPLSALMSCANESAIEKVAMRVKLELDISVSALFRITRQTFLPADTVVGYGSGCVGELWENRYSR